ncbi:MAG: hypothetical protein ABL962_10935 [Fimbriimonadaceae bacterium]
MILKTIFRFLGLLAGIAAVGALVFYAWGWYHFREAVKIDYWHRDGPPDLTTAKRLADWSYPASISRVTEIGDKSRATGDGENLTIYCFATSDVPVMKQVLGGGPAGWMEGFPAVDGWKQHIRDHAPLDLVIGPTADPKNYIHIPTPIEQMGMNRYWTFIDVVRGISYQIRIRT